MPTLTFDLPQEDEENLMLLKESDFISFFDQFPFSEMFKHILGIGESGTKHWECYFIVCVSIVCCCRGNSRCRDDQLPDAPIDGILDMPYSVARGCILHIATG